MRTIVVFGGRFQPPHRGHKASYDHLAKKYGDVYIASAEKAPGPKDPFTWDEKSKIFASMGVPADHIVKVKNAYVLAFLQEALPIDDDTVVILAISEKDGDRLIGKNKDDEGFAIKKNGERAAIQWLPKNPEPISSGHMYATITPTVEFAVAGQKITGATQVREMYANGDDKVRMQVLQDLYGKATPALKKLFDKKLSMQSESYLREYIEFINKF